MTSPFRRSFIHVLRLICASWLALLVITSWVDAVEKPGQLPDDLTKLSIEELMKIEIPSVQGASRYEQKVTNAPSSVSIITEADIKKYGYRTLADILRSVRSFFVTYDRTFDYAGVRGFGRPGDYNSRILLLIDGLPINENIYGSAIIGTDAAVDVDLIDRVEIIRGPSSSLYGAGAFFGVINIITRSGRDLKGPEFSGEVASFGTYKGRVTYGNQYKMGLEMILSGTYYSSDGRDLYFREFDTPSTNHGIAEGCDYGRSYSFFSKLAYGDFTLEGGYLSRNKGIPTAPLIVVFNDSRNRLHSEGGYVDLKYDHTFSNQLNAMARLYLGYSQVQGDYIIRLPYGGNILKGLYKYEDLGDGDIWGGELKLTKKVFDRHTLTLGGTFQDNFRQDQTSYIEFPPISIFDDKRDSKIWALYVQDEFAIFKNLILNAGVRHDQYSTFGGTTNPRIALIYHPFEKTFLKLLYGTAFRAPNVFELYSSGGGSKANPDLKPETIQTYELIWEQYLGTHLRGSASVFNYRMRDFINQLMDPTDNLLVYINLSKIKAKGLELELEGRWANGLEGQMSYTFQDARCGVTGKTLINSPKHLAKLNLSFPFIRDKLFASMEEQFTSKRKTFAGNEPNAFFITNFTLFSQNLIKGLEVSASVYNLFDKKYGDPGSAEYVQDLLMQDGRNYRLKVTYRF